MLMSGYFLSQAGKLTLFNSFQAFSKPFLIPRFQKPTNDPIYRSR